MALSWLKKGSESADLQKKAEAEAEIQKQSKGKLWRFFIKEGEEAKITFLDGDLSDQGFLLPPRFYEHMVKHNGKWTNFVCPEKTNPHSGEKCPICESGDKPALVAVFTIIDHRISTSGDKTYKDQKRLYAVKQQTFEMLNKLAIKRDGLTGTTWDVSRIGDKSPAAGNMFDFMGKASVDELQKTYVETVEIDGKKVVQTYATPAVYEEEITYHTGDELRQLFGASPAVAAGKGASQDFETEL
jgi:hypothetical protein